MSSCNLQIYQEKIFVLFIASHYTLSPSNLYGRKSFLSKINSIPIPCSAFKLFFLHQFSIPKLLDMSLSQLSNSHWIKYRWSRDDKESAMAFDSMRKSNSTKLCRYDWMRNYRNSWWHTSPDEFEEHKGFRLLFTFLEFIWDWKWSQQREF